MPAKAILVMGQGKTGFTIDNMTFSACNLVSDNTVQSTSGATMSEAGTTGNYILTIPLASEDALFSIYETADNLNRYDGVAEPDLYQKIDSTLSIAHGSGAWGLGTGAGYTGVNHNTPTSDNLQVVDQNGNGIGNVAITAYLLSDYTAGNIGLENVKGFSSTSTDGRWLYPIMLQSGYSYILLFTDPGFNTSTYTVSI